MKKSSAPIKIAIDGNEANALQRVGSNVYAHSLLVAMEQLTRKDQSNFSCEILLREAPRSDLPAERKGWKYQVIGPRRLWTQWALPKYLFDHRKQFDVFFTPGHYAPSRCPIPYCSSVMDLAYLTHPQTFRWRDRFQLSYWTKQSVQKAAKVFAISKATQSEIQRWYKKRKSDIVVTYPGAPEKISLTATQKKALLAEADIVPPFFLFVGTIQPRKQIPTLIRGFELFVTRFQTERLPKSIDPTKLPELILVGKVGWLAQESLATIKKSSVTKLIQQLGYADSQLQAALYTDAIGTLLVSEAEGFGLPPLEAMQYGSIPIVSNSSSLPEVVADAGLTVPVQNPEAIADAMWQALTLTAKQRAKLRKLGREQVAAFQWSDSAQIVLDTLQKVAKQK